MLGHAKTQGPVSGRQANDIAMLNDMAAYMNNQGAANDGRHANLPSLFWCVLTASALMYPEKYFVLRCACISDIHVGSVLIIKACVHEHTLSLVVLQVSVLSPGFASLCSAIPSLDCLLSSGGTRRWDWNADSGDTGNGPAHEKYHSESANHESTVRMRHTWHTSS